MTNKTLDRETTAPQAQTRQIKGFSPESVTVFTLGLLGFLIPFVGIVPSVIAVAKTRSAKKQLMRARGNFRGEGLVKAGSVLAWLGILNTLLTVALTVLTVWAAVNMPSLLPSLAGLSVADGALDPTAMLSILDSQDLKSLLSDPSVVKSLEERLIEAGVDPSSIFSNPTPTPTPKP